VIVSRSSGAVAVPQKPTFGAVPGTIEVVSHHGFADPWEHVRLLADRRRNAALVELLRRRAPGARVLEVGTGTGLLACLAARLGATKVYAVEETEMAEEARRLVDANGLGDVVEVVESALEELEPLGEVDLAFGELLNADPFVEGIIPAMEAAARWLAPEGHLAPSHIRLLVAPVVELATAGEVDSALAEVSRLGRDHDLEVSDLGVLLRPSAPYAYLAPRAELAAPAAVAMELPLGSGVMPPDELEVQVVARSDARAGGAALWFEAVLDDGLVLDNHPASGSHFGCLVSSWAAPMHLSAGQPVGLRLTLDDEGITLVPS